MRLIFSLVVLLCCFTLSGDQVIQQDKLKLGKAASSADKVIELNTNMGSANPKIRVTPVTNRLQFANDGVNYTDFGSGGGSAGFNALQESNPGFEQGTVSWAASGGTFTTTTTATDVGFGTRSGSWDASAASQNLDSALITIPSGLKRANCLARVYWKGGDANLKLQALDGSSNVLSETVLYTATDYATETASFVCPGSGSFRLRVTSTADAAAAFFDQMHLGENFLVGSISQAQAYGRAVWSGFTSCRWTSTSNSTFADYAADTDCIFPAGGNLSGGASAPATKIPAVQLNNLPPGHYMITATGGFTDSTSSGSGCVFRFSDGTNSSGNMMAFAHTVTELQTGAMVGKFSYATAGNRTITIQATGDGANETCDIYTSTGGANLELNVLKFPSTPEQALRIDQSSWGVDASISGANVDLSTGSVASFAEPENAALTIASKIGSLPVQIPCSGTNPSTGATCSAGNEGVGVVFNLPRAGVARACVTYSHLISAPASTSATVFFKLVETPNNAQTVTTDGTVFQNHQHNTGASAADEAIPFRLCEDFNFTSSGQKTIRVFYKSSIGGALTSHIINANSTVDATIHWSVVPLSQNFAAPLLVNSVITPNSGVMRIVRGNVTPGVGSCTLNRGEGFTVSDGSTGVCVVTFLSAFSAIPTCSGTLVGAVSGVVGTNNLSTTLVDIQSRDNTFALTDGLAADFICIGPK
jgi:hypothetical protein